MELFLVITSKSGGVSVLDFAVFFYFSYLLYNSLHFSPPVSTKPFHLASTHIHPPHEHPPHHPPPHCHPPPSFLP